MGALRYSHDSRRLNSGSSTLPGSTPAGLFALSLEVYYRYFTPLLERE